MALQSELDSADGQLPDDVGNGNAVPLSNREDGYEMRVAPLLLVVPVQEVADETEADKRLTRIQQRLTSSSLRSVQTMVSAVRQGLFVPQMDESFIASGVSEEDVEFSLKTDTRVLTVALQWEETRQVFEVLDSSAMVDVFALANCHLNRALRVAKEAVIHALQLNLPEHPDEFFLQVPTTSEIYRLSDGNQSITEDYGWATLLDLNISWCQWLERNSQSSSCCWHLIHGAGCCRHLVSIERMRQLHSSDAGLFQRADGSNAEICIVEMSIVPRLVKCELCQMDVATLQCWDDPLAPSNPCFMCCSCRLRLSSTSCTITPLI